MFEALKDGVVALLLGAARQGRQYTNDELQVLPILQDIDRARESADVSRLLDTIRSNRFFFEFDDKQSDTVDADTLQNPSSDSPQLRPTKIRHLIVTSALESLQKLLSSNSYAALTFVRLRGNALLHELLEAEYRSIGTVNTGTVQANRAGAGQPEQPGFVQKQGRGRIEYILDVARTVYTLWSSSHTNSAWQNNSATPPTAATSSSLVLKLQTDRGDSLVNVLKNVSNVLYALLNCSLFLTLTFASGFVASGAVPRCFVGKI